MLASVFGAVPGRLSMRRGLSVVLGMVLMAGLMPPVGASTQVNYSCVEVLSGWGSVQSSWSNGCMSHGYSERYARFFAFSLDSETSVRIAFESTSQSPYLFLYQGHDLRSAKEIEVSGWAIRKTLPAGDYMIEATTWYQWRSGAFALAVTEDVDPVPSVTINGGIGLYAVGDTKVTEGRSAVFTLSASPAPSAPLPVQVVVDQDGDFGVAMDLKDDFGGSYRAQTVIIPTSGSTTLTVATVDDKVDEGRGWVQVAIRVWEGWGYWHSGHGTHDVVYVHDNDPRSRHQVVGWPEVSVAAGSGVTEGGDAVFTVTAVPAPSRPLSVNVTVDEVGGFSSGTGSRTVTIPTSGSATVTVSTSDDDVNEPDGSVSLSVGRGSGYNVSTTQGTARVDVADDDLPTGCGSLAVLAAEARANHDALPDTANNRRQRNDWWRAWIALSGTTSTNNTPMTAAEAREVEFEDSRWMPFRAALECLEGTPSPAAPVVSVAAGSGVTEGGDAVFTVTASPAPSQPLKVNLTVRQWGHYGAATGFRTVTIPTSGSATVTLSTSNDGVDEPDGLVGVTVDSGRGYTVSSPEGTAIVAVADNDDPPTVPEVSVTAGPGVTEGGEASFTVTASPAPTQPLEVSVWVAQTGDFGVSIGTRTVTVPTSGTATVTVSTSDDSADEPDGRVTLSVRPGGGYTVASVHGLASVGVADDDDPPDDGCTVALAGSGTVLGGWDSSCRSRVRSGRFTRFFTFSLDNEAQVRIDLESSQDTYLYLRRGLDQRSAGVVAGDDDGGAGYNSRIATTLGAGDYTIEATTYSAWRSGSFTLKVSGVSTQSPDLVVPEVSVTAGNGITEGGDASFTVSASPAPTQPLSVSVTVGQTGDFGVSTGTRTVTVPTSGTATLTVSTSDDSTDEVDGSVTATVAGGSGYTASGSQGSASVDVADDDSPQAGCGSAGALAIEAKGNHDSLPNTAANRKERNDWWRAWIALSGTTGTFNSPLTAAEARVLESGDSRWTRFRAALECLEGVPVVSLTAGSGITEGGDASFTVTANPAPSAPLTVNVTVSQMGDYGATTGSRTVTVPTGGTATITVGTTDDSTDEVDGSVSVAVNGGSGYTVSNTQGSASVGVADDDVPSPVIPVVGVTAGSGITEGGDALFTVTASPAPSSPLSVSVTVTQSGDFGATTGTRSVTVPTSGAATLTVSTLDDSADEVDGSVSVAVNGGSGYTVSNTQGSASVGVADDDVPSPVIPVVGVTAGSGITEGGDALFTVTASPAPTSPLSVSVSVTQSGDFGVSTGSRSVTVPISGTATVSVSTSDDSTDEPNGSVGVTVDAGSGYTVSNTQGSATVDVADNDVPPPPDLPEVSVADGSVVEGEFGLLSLLEFQVTLSEPSEQDVTVRFRILSGTAINGLDYWGSRGQVTIWAGWTRATTGVNVRDDRLRERDETLVIELTEAEGAVIADNATATGTIIDND